MRNLEGLTGRAVNDSDPVFFSNPGYATQLVDGDFTSRQTNPDRAEVGIPLCNDHPLIQAGWLKRMMI